jgi:hypothetical protein
MLRSLRENDIRPQADLVVSLQKDSLFVGIPKELPSVSIPAQATNITLEERKRFGSFGDTMSGFVYGLSQI